MRLSLFTGLSALAAAAPTAPAENFVNSCDDKTVKVTGRILQANCKNILGALKCSKLDLNRCLKNVYGSLQADPSGAGPHLDQCVNCSNSKADNGFFVAGGPSLVECQCNPGTGVSQASWPTAFIDLNTVVDNDNGILECYGIRGTGC